MNDNIRRYIRIAIISVLSMIIGSVLTILIKDIDNTKCFTPNIRNRSEFDSLYETYDTITRKYYKNVDKDKLIEGAINGMLDSLDDEHTMYFDKKSKDEFNAELSGNYYGIGAQIQLTSEGVVKITKVFDNSPAEKAGLKSEDVFVSVDGVSVKGMNSSEVADMLKSESVKTSTIVVKRDDKELSFKVKKENITLFSVSSDIIKSESKNIGYLSVSIFGQRTYSEFINALDKLEKEKMDSLIIDLRGNTGGYLYTVTNMLETFLEKDKVMYQIQSSSGIKKYKSKSLSNKKYNIVILTDNNSASASEIMAAAMKEEYGAIIVGKTTYGKGTVQVTKTLKDGGMIKYTTEKWLTPSGKNIDKEGIKPDYDIDLGDEYSNNPTRDNDNQLQKALELLK